MSPLYFSSRDEGQKHKKSLRAHAETTIKYRISKGINFFAAAVWFGSREEQSSAIFRVVVNGKEKYNSGVMKLCTPVKPVVVDISGGKVLQLDTEDGGDGINGDYTFWGEARLIKE